MNRIFCTALMILSVGSTVEAEGPTPRPKLPTGSWLLSPADGSSINLTLSDQGATWVIAIPERGTTTMSAPACHISQEGIVYGYVREVSWVKGSESQKMTAITPFAFKAQVDKDSLIVSDFRMFGWDAASHKAVLGTYRMSPERNAKTPTPAEPKIQR